MEAGALIPAAGQPLRQLQPLAPLELTQQLGPGVYAPLPAQDSVLREYLRVLIKRKFVVLSAIVVIFLMILIATLRMVPIYDVAGSIAINKLDPGLITFKDSQGSGDSYDPADLDTEVRILKSDLLALQVIKQLNLDKRPEFGGTGNVPSPNTLPLATDSLQADSARTTALLGRFKSSLRVTLQPNTRVIEIHYASPNKELAATIVNTLVNTYIEQNFKTKAESDRMTKEALYRLTQGGDPDAIASARSSAPGESGATSTSGLLDSLGAKHADLKIQIAELSTQFGPSYPKVAQLHNQLKETDNQIQVEIRKTGVHVRNDYLAALERENMLKAAMDNQKHEANKLNESAIEYTLLRRDVETNRQLYEGLLEKLKEAGVTAGLRSNNVKVVDVARVPMAPSEPNLPRNLAFALLLGVTSGIGLAFLLENLDNTVRTPEQAQIIAALPALGMIPLGSK